MGCAFLAQDREKVVLWKIKSRVRWDRLEDHRCDLISVLVKCFSQKIDIIERQRNCEIDKCLRYSGAAGLAVRQSTAARLHEQRVNVSMITAIELDDFLAAGECAGEPYTGHGRFCAAVDHPHLFDRWHPLADQFRHLDFEQVGYSEA